MDDLNVTNGTKGYIGSDKPKWRKSSKSNFSGNCVEVATIEVSVLVRDSKNPGPVLQFSPSAWMAFIEHVKQTNC
jgi:hypothetical protein